MATKRKKDSSKKKSTKKSGSKNKKKKDSKMVQVASLWESEYEGSVGFLAPSERHGYLYFKESETGNMYRLKGTMQVKEPYEPEDEDKELPEGLQGNAVINLKNPKKAKRVRPKSKSSTKKKSSKSSD